jgi:broad specificity phosphatase PhoE
MTTCNPESKTIYFVRHGQSEGNVSTVYQNVDSPLTEKGQIQARVIAERLSRIPFEALVVSPVLRAKQTGEAITNKTGITAEYSDLFVERIKPSELAGKAHDDPEADAIMTNWEESLFTSGVRIPGGDNYDDLYDRTASALQFLSNHAAKTIVVVSHGFFLRTLFARILLGEEYTGNAARAVVSSLCTENTGLSAIRYDSTKLNPWELWICNDHSHLG